MKTRSKSQAFNEKAEKRKKLRGDEVLPNEYLPHRLDPDFLARCEDLGLCEDCGLIDLSFATEEEKSSDFWCYLCRCEEIAKHIRVGHRQPKDSLK